MRVTRVPDFDTLETALRKRKEGETEADRTRRNLQTAIHRLEKNAMNTKNRWAREWYTAKLEVAKMRLSDLTIKEQGADNAATNDEQVQQASEGDSAEPGWTLVTRGGRREERPNKHDTGPKETGGDQPTVEGSTVASTRRDATGGEELAERGVDTEGSGSMED